MPFEPFAVALIRRMPFPAACAKIPDRFEAIGEQIGIT